MSGNIQELKNSILELTLNITKRINDIHDNFSDTNEFENDRVFFLMEDLSTLFDGINSIVDETNTIDLLEFSEKLGMMIEALESNDEYLFHDVMIYELKPVLEGIYESI
ncbi:hypothetical protein [Sporosalibacterium faouarense]|uniref:hypothetical protein n=1 Tax=Sporosalibacterium faouarense TaxID=516123 RepID=UPI00141D0405|nr:hypothetical protein [Sporosalibacterium faouarense]MTI46799.1 hypothetical protein [Bacillota bacterium]